MKKHKVKIAYRIILVFLTIGILFSAVPVVLKLPFAVAHFTDVLKLPEYMLVFRDPEISRSGGIISLQFYKSSKKGYLQVLPLTL